MSGGVGPLSLEVVAVLFVWGIGFSGCRVSCVKPPLELLGVVRVLFAAGFYWGSEKGVMVLLVRLGLFARCGARNSYRHMWV